MAIELTQTVKGISVNNAYLKIIGSAINASRPPKGSTATTVFSGSVTLGIFANKALADASQGNSIGQITVQIPDFTTLSTGNVVASLYTYLLTLPQFAGSTSI